VTGGLVPLRLTEAYKVQDPGTSARRIGTRSMFF